jgi:hypothetical protein
MYTGAVEKIQRLYNPEFDCIPNGPEVTWASAALANAVLELAERVETLEQAQHVEVLEQADGEQEPEGAPAPEFVLFDNPHAYDPPVYHYVCRQRDGYEGYFATAHFRHTSPLRELVTWGEDYLEALAAMERALEPYRKNGGKK